MTELLRDRYEPIEVVGQGGEGRVIKALDHQHDRVVALKLRPVHDQTDRDQLLREARLLLDVGPHPHLPLVREDFFDGDQYVIAMDWIDGTDLGRLLRARGRSRLAPSSVLCWLADAASALTHLHTLDRPVVHGDVKPANLVLTTGGRVVLVDFGLSSSPESPRRPGGTAGFAAPELAAGQAPSRASDVYSLAATAFALLTGEAPSGIRPAWDGIDEAAAAQLEAAIRAGLATDPARRPASAGELVELLRAGWGSTLPAGVLTFCLTEIDGAAALWEANPDAMARSSVRHAEVVADAAARHGGRCLSTTGAGDATVSVFTAGLDAVAAVIDVHRQLAEPAGSAGGAALRVRAALHTGETDQRSGDYSGPALHLAVRLRDLAEGGQVLLSEATTSAVRAGLPDGVAVVDLGPHQLRDLQRTEHVHALSAPGVDAPPDATGCPYPGLLPFERDDAARFFGRDDAVTEVVARLRSSGFVAVVGPSGSGKSSLLRAGVSAEWGGAILCTPGDRPAPIADGPGLAVVDQLEEAFTRCTDPERRAAFLTSIVERTGPVAVGLRADFYGRAAEHAGLARVVTSEQVLLGPMTDDDLRRAITGPAEAAGLRVEPALVDILVDGVSGEPGALPLLAHTLRATWEQRDGRTLTVDAYRRTGGVRAGIATTAERVYGSLDEPQRQLARQVFLALTDPGDGTLDTSRRATMAELTPVDGAERVEALLDAMANARLVSVGAGTVEVAHEALIRSWPRLRTWLDEDRDGLRLHRHLTSAAAAWDGLGRDPAELYRGPRLVTATEWAAAGHHMSALEASFLDASTREQERHDQAQTRANRRLRRLLVTVGGALVLALLAGTIAIDRQREAARSRDLADVSRVAAVSRSVVDRQPDLGLLLAAAAFGLDDTADTHDALLTALEAHSLLEGLIYGRESGLEAAVLTPDGRVLITPTSDGTGTILWDTSTRQQIDVLTNGRELILDAAVSPDGRWLAVPAIYQPAEDEVGGRLDVWDLATRTLETSVESPAGGLSTAAFTADGSRLYTQAGITRGTPTDVVVVWDTSSWTATDTWQIADDYVGDGTFVLSPDGARAAMPMTDGTVHTFVTANGALLGPPIVVRDLSERDPGVLGPIAFSRDGSVLAIATELDGVILVDPATGRVERRIEVPESAVLSLEIAPGGRTIAAGRLDGRTQLYDIATGEASGPPLAASAAEITDVTFSADGSRLVTAGRDRTGAIWRLDGSRSIGARLDDRGSAITEAAFTADGSRLVTGGLDGTVAVHDARSGRIDTTLALGNAVLSVDLDPTGPRLAAGGAGSAFIAGLGGGDRRALDIGDAWAQQVAFTPDGDRVMVALDHGGGDPSAVGPGSGEVRFFSTATGRPIGPSIELDEPALAVDVAPDGRSIAVVAANNLVHLYDASGGHEFGEPIENVDAPITSVAFAPDGTRLAGGLTTGAVRQYDVGSREPIGALLQGDANPVYGVAYSPDGTLLAATSLGFSTTRIWDARTGAPIGTTLTGGRVPYSYRTFTVEHVMGSRPAFSPDGTALATPGFPGATVLWNLEPTRWLSAACAIAGRDLTEEEWDRYLPGRDRRPVCPA